MIFGGFWKDSWGIFGILWDFEYYWGILEVFLTGSWRLLRDSWEIFGILQDFEYYWRTLEGFLRDSLGFFKRFCRILWDFEDSMGFFFGGGDFETFRRIIEGSSWAEFDGHQLRRVWSHGTILKTIDSGRLTRIDPATLRNTLPWSIGNLAFDNRSFYFSLEGVTTWR